MTKLATCLATTVLASMLCAGCGDSSSPTTPSPTSPTTQAFSSTVAAHGGAATRFFSASQQGTITITLSSLGQPVTVGLGLGVAASSATGCYLSTVVETSAASDPQIVMSVDAGSYCVRVFDVGNLPEASSFTITIVAP